MTAHTLILVRHAQAEGRARAGDRGRQLTGAGRDQARRLGVLVAQEIPRVGTAVCSPAVRAVETMEGIADSVDIGRSWEDEGVYLGGVDQVLELARAMDGDSAMIVGHEPTVSSVAAVLAAGEGPRTEVGLGVPTATAVLLRFEGSWADLDEGTCEVQLLHAAP